MAQQGGWRIADIAKALGRGSATIGRGFDKFRQGGIPALLKRGHGARSPQLDSADQQALKKGLEQRKWKTAKEIQHWLAEERQIQLSLSGVHYWLTKVRARCKVPRKKHKEIDSLEVETFKAEVVDKLHELDLPKDKCVCICEMNTNTKMNTDTV